MNNKKESLKKRVDRQEKFAEENFAGLPEMGEKFKNLLLEYNKTFDDFVKLNKKDTNFDVVKNDLTEIVKNIETVLTVFSIKLTNTVGHALNASSTKYIKKVISFMDKYGLSDAPIHSGIIKVVSKRVGNGGLYEMSLVVAAINNDLEFAKEIFKLVEKNKNRENVLEDIYRMDYSLEKYGDFSKMTRIYDLERIAFEALVHGHKEVYEFLNSKAEIKEKMIKDFITPMFGRSSLSDVEAMNLVTIRPEFIDYIADNSPDLLPSTVRDMFIF